jgi:hypothetical protein
MAEELRFGLIGWQGQDTKENMQYAKGALECRKSLMCSRLG